MTDTAASSRHWQGLLLAALAIASFVLCFVGFLGVDGGRDLADWRSWADALYKSIRVWVFEYDGPSAPEEVPVSLHLGRFGALVSVLWGSWMAAVALLKERATPLRLWLKAPDIVFCGMTPELLRIARVQRRSWPGARMALLVPDANAPLAQQFRKELSSLVLTGDPAATPSLETLRLHRVDRCAYVAGVTDEDTLRTVQAIVQYTGQRTGSPLKVVALLQDTARLRAPPASFDTDRQRIDLNWISPAMLAVRTMLDRLPPDMPGTASHDRLHVVLAGSTPFIEALLLQLARNVYPRAHITRVTLIAPDAMQFRRRVYEHHPALAKEFADDGLFPGLHPLIEIEAIDQNPAVMAASDLEALNRQAPIACVYVHTGQDSETLLVCRRWQQLRARSELPLAIGLLLDEPLQLEGIATVSEEQDIFASRPEEAYLGQHLDELAVLHNYAYRPGNHIPDFDTPAVEHERARQLARAQWRDTPQWQRDSSRHVADHIAVKLRHLGLDALTMQPLDVATAKTLRQDLLAALPRLGALEHRRYCAERMLDGWLPVSDTLWNSAGGQHRDRLKSLKLNATLTLEVDAGEMAKDERLAIHIPWILWQVSQRTGQDAASSSS